MSNNNLRAQAPAFCVLGLGIEVATDSRLVKEQTVGKRHACMHETNVSS